MFGMRHCGPHGDERWAVGRHGRWAGIATASAAAATAWAAAT